MPVGCFPEGASPYGVMDMCGNVAEWTVTPISSVTQPFYLIKGASAAYMMKYNFRCASRMFFWIADASYPWVGFRCVKDKDAGSPTSPIGESTVLSDCEAPPPQLASAVREDLYLKEPIRIFGGTGQSAILRASFFPDGQFGLLVPEDGTPFSWGMKHTPFQWEVNSDNTQAVYETTFEGKVTMCVAIESGLDHVDFTITLKNLTDRPFTTVRTNTCFQSYQSPYISDPEWSRTFIFTDDGPTGVHVMSDVFPIWGGSLQRNWIIPVPSQPAPAGATFARVPLICTKSTDNNWVVAQAYEEGSGVAGNAHFSCLHVYPKWPQIPAGDERAITGKLYFLKGGPDELLARWKQDYKKEM